MSDFVCYKCQRIRTGTPVVGYDWRDREVKLCNLCAVCELCGDSTRPIYEDRFTDLATEKGDDSQWICGLCCRPGELAQLEPETGGGDDVE